MSLKSGRRCVYSRCANEIGRRVAGNRGITHAFAHHWFGAANVDVVVVVNAEYTRQGEENSTNDKRFDFATWLQWNQDAPENEGLCEETTVERDIVEVYGTGGVEDEVFAHDGKCAVVRTSGEYDARVGGHFWVRGGVGGLFWPRR